jgi:hypothetical protein
MERVGAKVKKHRELDKRQLVKELVDLITVALSLSRCYSLEGEIEEQVKSMSDWLVRSLTQLLGDLFYASRLFAVEPGTIEDTSPPSVTICKDSYLNPGLPTSNICSRSTTYHTTSHSAYDVIGFNFGSGVSFSNQYSPGDSWHTDLITGDQIYDANANGIVWQLYTLTWYGSLASGRNIQVYLAYIIVYSVNGVCNNYNDQIYLPLSSRKV